MRRKIKNIIFFIDLIYRSSDIDNLGSVDAASLTAWRRDFVGDCGGPIFA